MIRRPITTLATVMTLGVASLGPSIDAGAAPGDGDRAERRAENRAERRHQHAENRAYNRAYNRAQRRADDRAYRKGYKRANRHYDRAYHQGYHKGYRKAQRHNYGRYYTSHNNRHYNRHYRKHYRKSNWHHANRHFSNHWYFYNNYNHFQTWQPYFGGLWSSFYISDWDRANGCHPVVRVRGHGHNARLVGATMCYDDWGNSYVVRGTRQVLYRY